MAIQSNFRGNFIAGGAKPPRPVFSAQPDCPGCPILRRGEMMPLKKFAIAAALLAWASPALAETLVESSNCKYSWYYGDSNCRTTWTKIADPVRNPEQERLDAVASKGRREMGGVLQATFKADEHGVRRASYASGL